MAPMVERGSIEIGEIVARQKPRREQGYNGTITQSEEERRSAFLEEGTSGEHDELFEEARSEFALR